MTPEEARQFLDKLAPGELERLLSESIVSQEKQDEFKKRLALFLESDLVDSTTKLSSAAQAVLDAANDVCMYRPDREDTRLAVAAALRAAADQMSYAGADEAATWLAQIAAELEGQ